MAKPLDDCEMAGLMAAAGPFEDRPHIAVAVSGGADSMALTLLADGWARGRGGRVTALGVDHGLRSGSAGEARRVAGWLDARGIEYRILTWSGEKPLSAIQATARKARYRLLADWCRRAGILHLLLAHNQEDQAETFLMRLRRDSGVDGLAAMAMIVEKPAMRLLRPLLTTPRARLEATLKDRRQPWLEDPSNDNPVFERVRIRQSMAHLRAAGITAPGLAQAARRMARARIALERQTSGLLAACCSLHDAGYARIDGAALFSAADEISLRAVGRTLMCVGGADFATRPAKLERLHEIMKAAFSDRRANWKGATLGRCRILALKGDGFLVCREGRALPPPVIPAGAMEMAWDNRFRIIINGRKGVSYQDARLQPLGRPGLVALLRQEPEISSRALPAAAAPGLPALVDGDGIVAVPHLNYRRRGLSDAAVAFERSQFHPRQTLSGTGFLVAQ